MRSEPIDWPVFGKQVYDQLLPRPGHYRTVGLHSDGSLTQIAAFVIPANRLQSFYDSDPLSHSS